MDILMIGLWRRLTRNDNGAAVIEFTMIVALIAVAAIASMRSVSSKVSMVLATLN
jgi:Flp pilus assembly pilin Flp